MTAGPRRGYAVGYLRDVRFGEEIVEYLRRIEATLAPYGGEWLVHGATLEPREGSWTGDLVIIGFPTVADARAWYDSPGYQEIGGLRTRNSDSMAALVEGVPPGYRVEQTLARLLAARPVS